MADQNVHNTKIEDTSYARPGKLFPANQDFMISQIATLKSAWFKTIIDAVIYILSSTPVQ